MGRLIANTKARSTTPLMARKRKNVPPPPGIPRTPAETLQKNRGCLDLALCTAELAVSADSLSPRNLRGSISTASETQLLMTPAQM